ncbi:MAG: SufD family Fe-S cluster assembly protein [Nanoarchaeota archaeon]|nr:SufD family Fe-S cluster assembly protein [Nanoarchaeota archaeon]
METITINEPTTEPLLLLTPESKTILIKKDTTATIITQGKTTITINLQTGATLHYYHITNEENSNLDVRQEINLLGTNATATIINLLYGKNQDHSKVHTIIEHLAEHTTSTIINRGILKGKAHNTTTGAIIITKQATKAIGHQDMKTIILEEAQAYNLPELAISTNDVQCSHASSVGQIDQEQLFYLQSRGLTTTEATTTIIEGFYEPILQTLPEQARTYIKQHLKERP